MNSKITVITVSSAFGIVLPGCDSTPRAEGTRTIAAAPQITVVRFHEGSG